MIFPRINKFVFAFLLICILPYCASAQKAEEVQEVEKQKKEWMFWNKIKEWKIPSFDLFKHFKDGKEERKENRLHKKENSHQNQYSIGTNLLGWAYFGTANFEFNASLSNKFSVFAGGKYNDLQFVTKGHKEVFNNQISGYAGVKWWPWFVNTGWWVGIKGQYSDFSTAGIQSSYQRDGIAVGGGLSGGYSFMLGSHFNLDLGAGVWGGAYLDYVDYQAPDKKPGMFVKMDNIQVSFIYIF